MEKLLEVRNLQVCFHTSAGTVQAIRDASFHVNRGEVMAIVGESGSGKSVTTQAMMRLIPSPPGEITGGEAIFEGRDLLKMSEKELLKVRGKDISVIFQDAMTALNPTMRIGQQITEMILEHAGFDAHEADQLAGRLLEIREAGSDPAQLEQWILEALRPTPAQLMEDKGQVARLLSGGCDREKARSWILARGKITKEQAYRRAVELLDMVKIPDPEKRMRQYIFQCSGGMRQRVMIAMALACRPKLIIADEPTTALDVTIKAEILDLIAQLMHELNTSIILITHDLGMVASYADRIGVMYGGQFVEMGTSHEVFYQAQHPYTVGLMGAVPRLDKGAEQNLAAIPGTPPNLHHMPAGCAFSPRCAYCMEICKGQMPPVTQLGDTHSLRCWLSDPRAAGQRALFERREQHG